MKSSANAGYVSLMGNDHLSTTFPLLHSSSLGQILYMSNNKVKDWKEFDLLKGMESLQELLMTGNPLQAQFTDNGLYIKQNKTKKKKKKRRREGKSLSTFFVFSSFLHSFCFVLFSFFFSSATSRMDQGSVDKAAQAEEAGRSTHSAC